MLCGWDHCIVLGGCLFFLSWLPGFAEVESLISVDVIWMHLSFITQKPGNYPKENILHKEQGESLKSRKRTNVDLTTKTVKNLYGFYIKPLHLQEACSQVRTWNGRIH